MKLSDFLVDKLYKLSGSTKIFGYIGGMIAHVADSIYLNSNVEMINTITEQGAGFAAEGYARTTNKAGIVIATSGPGATNLVTPIANCYFDSSPVIFITGQVNTYEYQKYPIKQCGFQETNIVDIVEPVTKYAKIITNADDINYELEKAYHIAMSGRKGPVLLDIPMDIQRSDIDILQLKSFKVCADDNNKNIIFNKELIEKSVKPLILVGNGVNLSGCKEQLNQLLLKTEIPVVESLLGIDCVLDSYKYNLGMIGTYGNRYANLALYLSDLLIVLGSRLDIRQTGSKIDYMNNKTIVHVDIDKSELDCDKFNKIKINSDVFDFITLLLNSNINLDISDWRKKCIDLKNRFGDSSKIYKKPNLILSCIFDELKDGDVIIADVGQNQVWTGQSAKIKNGQRFFSSGGHGCMGFSLPAAIGAAVSGKRVIVITGDGGFQMNIQELEILKRRNLPVKIIILNNHNLGMVRTFQELYFDSRLVSTVEDYSTPDFVAIAKAYGIDAINISSDKFDINNLSDLLNSNSPTLINIEFEQKTQVEPRLQFGNSIENSHPLLSNMELEEILD